MNLYDQLRQLQIIEHAYTEWQNYREQLTKWLMSQLPLGAQLALWGAGRCNDLDLNQLAKHCETIWLLDKDEEAMKQALAQYGLKESEHMKIKQCDFTGISDEAYRAYADQLITEIRRKGLNTNLDDLTSLALAILKQVEREFDERVLNLGNKCYDYSVMIGVHSQLINLFDWIWQVILQTLGQTDERVRLQLIQFNEKVVRKVNRALWQATRYEAMIGCEMGKVNQIGTIQGAIQALEDIEIAVLKKQINRKNKFEIEWPFDKAQGTRYQMIFQTLQIKG